MGATEIIPSDFCAIFLADAESEVKSAVAFYFWAVFEHFLGQNFGQTFVFFSSQGHAGIISIVLTIVGHHPVNMFISGSTFQFCSTIIGQRSVMTFISGSTFSHLFEFFWRIAR